MVLVQARFLVCLFFALKCLLLHVSNHKNYSMIVIYLFIYSTFFITSRKFSRACRLMILHLKQLFRHVHTPTCMTIHLSLSTRTTAGTNDNE